MKSESSEKRERKGKREEERISQDWSEREEESVGFASQRGGIGERERGREAARWRVRLRKG